MSIDTKIEEDERGRSNSLNDIEYQEVGNIE